MLIALNLQMRDMQMAKKAAKKQALAGLKRTKVSQHDVPRFSLDEALRIPEAIIDHYGGDATAPLHVARAVNLTPASGHFRNLCGAAIGYGLTEGGPNAATISVTQLARRIFRPLEEGDDLAARREALLTPRVISDFLKKYDGSPLPRTDIAKNVLQELGVPQERTKEVLDLILRGAQTVGLLAEIKDKTYVDLSGVEPGSHPPPSNVPEEERPARVPPKPHASDDADRSEAEGTRPRRPAAASDPDNARQKRRVFITHGKDTSILTTLKKLLSFGELEPIVAAEQQSVAKPVPDKVLDSMRDCGAAIIHVDAEQRLMDKSANEHVVLNPNVLIEIGAAMALYGRRFILLVPEGVSLPSNLQGLYEVRYTGSNLDGDATIRLLEAINEMKQYELPTEAPVRPSG